MAKTRSGHNSERSSSLGGASKLADFYRDKLSTHSDTLLPLIAYYPVERAVLDIPLKINGKHSFEQLDGYENSLNQGVDFRRFFEWFRQREDAENEKGISEDMFAAMSTLLTIDEKMKKSLIEMKAAARDRQLNAVRTAIKAFMPGFENLRIQRKPTLMMLVDKDGKTLNVEQLSQGEKSLIALVGDIARRLAMMNPNSGYPSEGNPFIESPSRRDPLHGDGIILIDEADLHLHPKWQRTLIAQLSSTFPNCQFVLTTHSPLLISDSKNVLCYQLDEDELIQMDELYGLDANQVLLKVMDTDIRNADINEQLTQLLDNIQDRKLPQAQAIYDSLANELQPGHIELAKARLLIRKLELRHANNL